MTIAKETQDKKRFLPLLLLADEQEDMIDRYLERGDLYVLYNDDSIPCAVAVVTHEGDGVCELKNLATDEAHQGKGYGCALIEHVARQYGGSHHTILVGTGDGSTNVSFYERRGFVRSHVLKDFFTRHYANPIVEDGVQITDMVYLKRTLGI